MDAAFVPFSASFRGARRIAGVLAALAMLAGCAAAGISPPIAPAPGTSASDRGEASSDLERVVAPHKDVRAKCKGFSKNSFCTYTARGTASGILPGTFVAKGEYTLSGKPPQANPNCDCSWNFEERFTIKSEASTLSGTISIGGNGKFPIPGVFQYTIDNGRSGKVEIQSIGLDNSDFRETFYGM
jgi:hypothetical protein